MRKILLCFASAMFMFSCSNDNVEQDDSQLKNEVKDYTSSMPNPLEDAITLIVDNQSDFDIDYIIHVAPLIYDTNNNSLLDPLGYYANNYTIPLTSLANTSNSYYVNDYQGFPFKYLLAESDPNLPNDPNFDDFYAGMHKNYKFGSIEFMFPSGVTYPPTPPNSFLLQAGWKIADIPGESFSYVSNFDLMVNYDGELVSDNSGLYEVFYTKEFSKFSFNIGSPVTHDVFVYFLVNLATGVYTIKITQNDWT